jgi:hypothetical protein
MKFWSFLLFRWSEILTGEMMFIQNKVFIIQLRVGDWDQCEHDGSFFTRSSKKRSKNLV